MLGKPLVRFREGRGGNWALILEAPRLLDPTVRSGMAKGVKMSTEGAAQIQTQTDKSGFICDPWKCRALGAHPIHQSDPDLTVGPIQCRPFGPQQARNDLTPKTMQH